jgi:uncharacterized protein (DUF302 family)
VWEAAKQLGPLAEEAVRLGALSPLEVYAIGEAMRDWASAMRAVRRFRARARRRSGRIAEVFEAIAATIEATEARAVPRAESARTR